MLRSRSRPLFWLEHFRLPSTIKLIIQHFKIRFSAKIPIQWVWAEYWPYAIILNVFYSIQRPCHLIAAICYFCHRDTLSVSLSLSPVIICSHLAGCCWSGWSSWHSVLVVVTVIVTSDYLLSSSRMLLVRRIIMPLCLGRCHCLCHQWLIALIKQDAAGQSPTP